MNPKPQPVRGATKPVRVPIKPLSVNAAYRGRRFRTEAYKDYRDDLFRILPKLEIPDGKLQVHYIFGFSNKGQDYDGAIKNLQDVLQEAYGFNDNQIYYATIEKIIVPKSQEFIEFSIDIYEKPIDNYTRHIT